LAASNAQLAATTPKAANVVRGKRIMTAPPQ
jgi:hypothetical protein